MSSSLAQRTGSSKHRAVGGRVDRRADVRTFDFRRPSTLSRDQVRTLQIVQDNLARGLSTVFAGMLRAVSTVSPLEIEQCTYDEYLQSVPNPTLLTLLTLSADRSGSLLEIPLPLAYAAVELLLGGTANGEQPNRAMTDLELSLIRIVVDAILPEFASACHPLMEVAPEVVGVESNPQFAQVAAPSEMVILVAFEVKLEGATGAIRFCLPLAGVQPALDAMASRNGVGAGGRGPADTTRVHDHLVAAPVALTAKLRPAVARSRQILDLAIGDIVLVSHAATSPVSIEVQGVDIYEAMLGRLHRQLALEITDAVEPGHERRPARLRVIKSG
jgi:flagellar motor switch protein FliM